MASTIRLWTIGSDDRLAEISELSMAEQGVIEQRIETCLESRPDAIGDGLLLIGRQVRTGSGWLDLLAISSDGTIVVIELKRDQTPKETVAQALDYASWIAEQSEETIREVASQYLQEDLDVAFQERFQQPLLDLNTTTPSIRIVASRLDESTERMIQHLPDQYGMDINGIVLRYARLASGAELLARTAVSIESVPIGTARPPDPSLRSEATLMQMAADHGSTVVVQRLRGLSDFLLENPTRTYEGSFRYWDDGRMLCGVNVAGKWTPESGTADTWVNYGTWAQRLGVEPSEVLERLDADFTRVNHFDRAQTAMYLIDSVGASEKFVEIIRSWIETGALDGDAGASADGH